MNVDQLTTFLWWCAGINYLILMVWFGLLVCAHEWVYRVHSRWFRLSPEAFDACNYLGVAIYKIGNLLLFLVPALALSCLRA
jgi:hypothetical protein